MGAYLTISVSESSVNKEKNTSVVKATLYCHSSSGSWNGSSKYGYITIDGSKHTFHSSFKSNTTTTLSSYSKTVTHDSNGGGKITIKGYYETGVSSGNISKTITHTLSKIDRTYTIKFDANDGTGAPSSQTKTYGKTLTLSSTKPQRVGFTFIKWNTKKDGSGTSYNPGGSYTSNSAATLYAQWQVIRYDVNFSTTNTTNPGSITLNYTDTSTTWPNAYGDGWYVKYWRRGTKQVYFAPDYPMQSSAGALYTNTDTFIAQEEHYYVTCNYKYEDVIYGSFKHYYYEIMQNPSAEDLNLPIPEDKSFVGWSGYSDGSGTIVVPNKNYRFVGGKDKSYSKSYYAVLKDKDDINIKYNELSEVTDIGNEYRTFYSPQVSYDAEHTIESVEGKIVKNVQGFRFTGYWSINKEAEFELYEDYGLPNKYLFPYNFEVEFDENHYNASYGLVEAGYKIEGIKQDVNLYPVYKDNSDSGITLAKSFTDYVNPEDYPERDVSSKYFSYLTGQTSSFDIVLLGNYYVVAWKLLCPDNTTELVTNNLCCKVYDESGGMYSDEPIDTYYSLEFYNAKWDEDGSKYYYLIISNADGSLGHISNVWDDPEYLDAHVPVSESGTYRFVLEGLVDNSGKEVEVKSITLSPPNIIRDINSTGDVISYFAGAREEPKYGEKPEFWINGNLVLTGNIYSPEGDRRDDTHAFDTYNLTVENSEWTPTFSLSMIDDTDGEWEWDTLNESETEAENKIDYKLFKPWFKFKYNDDEQQLNIAKAQWRGLHNYPLGKEGDAKTGGLKIEKYLEFVAEVLNSYLHGGS